MSGTPAQPGDVVLDETNELVMLLAPFWSEAKVRSELGDLPAETLSALRESGVLLGLQPDDGGAPNNPVYPDFQFQRRDGVVEVKPALLPVLRILRDAPRWSVAVFLRTPIEELNDLTPMDWIHQGGNEEPLAQVASSFAHDCGR